MKKRQNKSLQPPENSEACRKKYYKFSSVLWDAKFSNIADIKWKDDGIKVITKILNVLNGQSKQIKDIFTKIESLEYVDESHVEILNNYINIGNPKTQEEFNIFVDKNILTKPKNFVEEGVEYSLVGLDEQGNTYKINTSEIGKVKTVDNVEPDEDGNVKLDKLYINTNIVSDVNEGAIKVGDVITKGTTLEGFVKMLVEKTFFPTFVAPTFSLSNNAGTREIGETINLTLTGTFNRGAINIILGDGVSTKQNDRAGVANEYIIDGTSSSGNTKTITGYKVKSSNSFSATVNYVQGPQPKDSKGNNFQTPLSAGSLNASSSFTGYYKRFYGPSDGNTAPRALPSNAFDNAPTTFNLVTGTTYRIFELYIPNNRTLSEVLDLDALNANITANYVFQGTVQVADAGGDMVTYKHYRMTNDIPYGESHRHQIKL